MSAKEIRLAVITPALANAFIRTHHYSGKVVPNSQLHFGVYKDGVMHGVMQFGASINKKGTINTVSNSKWNEFIELNRMAFDEHLGKNTESRAIAVSMALLRKNAPHIKWVISFADATACGDGTIYRASGFKLINIAKNMAIRINPTTGERMHTIQAHHKKMSVEFRKWEAAVGYQLKYIYFIDKSREKDLAVPVIPFYKIKDLGVSMYKGEKTREPLIHRD
jgi:hypothetical protein